MYVIAHSSSKCHQECGHNKTVKHRRFPFIGTSSACQIRLNCSTDGDIMVGEFPVRSIFPKAYWSTWSQANVSKSHCQYLLSSISVDAFNTSSVVLDVGIVQLGWWLLGECKCHQEATCTEIQTPVAGQQGFRCKCRDGFDGDGYQAGVGCRKGEFRLPEFLNFLHLSMDEMTSENRNGPLKVEGKPLIRPLRKSQSIAFRLNWPLMMGRPILSQAPPTFRASSSGCNPSRYISGQCGGPSRFFVLAGGIALMISISAICCFMRRCLTSKARNSTRRRLSEATGKCSIPIYPYRAIEKATSSFSEKQRLGTGAYGTVYSGKLHNQWVAIKRIKHRDTDSIEEVLNEIKLISSVSHPNLVRLLGCSIEKGEQILVYEFMANGTLSQHLQRERGNGLVWAVRLSIATQTAQAIAHLHSALNPPIYHRDIKSSNILLDHNFIPKLADFGLSRLGMAESSHISTAPQGTPGYLDPQYHQNFHLSDKSDVYSFGVVLVEIITALKVVDFSRPQNEVNLAALAIDRIGKGRLDEIIDPFLEPHGDAWSLSSLHKVAELAFRCLAFHRDMRPSMMEVAAELEQIKLCKWATSEDNICTASSETSSCSSSSNVSEIPLSMTVEKGGLGSEGLFVLPTKVTSMNSLGRLKDTSPVSVQDPWLSGQSSPSSNSLLSNIIQRHA
ncbi:Wall-associated receptor kinase-like 14 [Vitis vinifera]|uniref:Wall-associated receptor kinase-like 14 n=1 Tax=Vitis vinifera TaxID=29760 RepID=A0A438K257_VITVI|nr:Wall-associated receptor kinase-like 14 [Vitis vinifera]